MWPNWAATEGPASLLTLEYPVGVEWQGKTEGQDEMDTVIGYFYNKAVRADRHGPTLYLCQPWKHDKAFLSIEISHCLGLSLDNKDEWCTLLWLYHSLAFSSWLILLLSPGETSFLILHHKVPEVEIGSWRQTSADWYGGAGLILVVEALFTRLCVTE